ncbi:MAG: zf-HC2 domain-containing protein, partial [Chloroherpetonaceae bacterium]|nr:zf-HC2 domain-containing protein [Chloroherpetonaceae bacterium]
MNCREFEREIADYVAGRLNPVDANRMLAHADACASCRTLEQEERALRQRFAGAPEVTLSTDLWAKLAPQLQERPVRRARWLWRWSWPLPSRMVLAPVASLAVMAG